MAFETGPDQDDLAWLAFGYATGDLDPDASAAFERRLGEDQWAREAVAEAVLLADSVALAAKAERRGRLGRRAAAVALAAACLAIAAGPRLLAPPRAAAPAAAVAAAGPEAVALAWSGLRQEAEAVNGPEPDDTIDWPTEPAAEPGDAIPHWLLEAASLPAADTGQGS
ncbi:MAG: hypothetical protein LC745_12430 [Planctomycetia bacterium]|nr:hypothetical protein [Planctomycetia bacterium]